MDVGAGPLTTLGNECNGQRVDLFATDVLAATYNKILAAQNVTPPVRTMYAAAEHLEKHFDAGSFDLVHCSNALDHSQDPYQALRSMLAVVKLGHKVLVYSHVNESTRMLHAGMHRYDLFPDERGHLMLIGYAAGASASAPPQVRDLTESLKDVAHVTTRREPYWRTGGPSGLREADCAVARPRDCRLVVALTRTWIGRIT